MTQLTSLARAEAETTGRAQPVKTVRHVHLADRPLVLVAAQLAGEACAPLAVMVGDHREKPRLLVVHEPRDRTQRFEFAADLASVVLPYVDSCTVAETDDTERDGTGPDNTGPGSTGPGSTGPDNGARAEAGKGDQLAPYPDAPQLLVPNLPTAAFIRLLGRSTRFRKVTGEHAVPPAVPLLGHWLSYFAERTELSPSAILLPMTAVLADHWATGQSATEDANLATLLAWIDPPAGVPGAAAARAAEEDCPPAGPATDPAFDADVLAPAIEDVARAVAVGDGAALTRARDAMDQALRSQLEPTWALMWRAVDLLRALPEAAHAPDRWLSDRRSFTYQVAWLRDGGAPQPRRDSAVAAARRLARLEREQQRLAVQRAFDDPLVMAEYRLTGEAFAGVVVEADPERQVTSGRRAVLRPRITVETGDEILAGPGAVLTAPSRPNQKAKIIKIEPTAARTAGLAGGPLDNGAEIVQVEPPAARTATGLIGVSLDTLPPVSLDSLPRVPSGGGAQAVQAAPSAARTLSGPSSEDATPVTRVTLELSGGMGRKLTPEPGSVPVLGEGITYTTLKDEFQQQPKFPAPENTPWTHGGPPQVPGPAAAGDAAAGDDVLEERSALLELDRFTPEQYVPTDDDAGEDWS